MNVVELGRRNARLACIVLAVVVPLSGCGGGSNSDQGAIVPSFYDPPSPLPFGEPGAVIKTGGVPDAPSGLRIQRIMYHSRTNDDADIATTGLLVLPSGDPPAGGWPLLVAAHGTTGIVQECGPSVAPFSVGLGAMNSYYDFFFKYWVDRGFAVVGADYQGEGAPGPYSFLVGKVEGQNVLDSARAAFRIHGDKLSGQMIIYGHSQGGNSAGFAALMLPSYAPELNNVGTILAAPAAELEDLLARAYRGGAGATVPNEAVVFFYLALLSYQDSYDGLDANDLLLDYGRQGIDIFQNVCATTGGAAFLLNEGVALFNPHIADEFPFTPPQFFIPLEQYPPAWDAAIARNSLGTDYDTPILIVQGCKDTTIPIETNFLYFNEALCPADAIVEFTAYPDASHSGVVTEAQPEMVEWARRRLQGLPAGDTCATPPSCPQG